MQVNRVYLVLSAMSALAVVYGSILPLNYRPISLEEALLKWQTIPWINLGIYHRSDWIANALVILPTAFLLMGAIGYEARSVVLKCIGALLSVLVLFALVFGIEFLQIWFPTRTLSQNDILAGCCGVLAGVSLWLAIGSWLTDQYVGFFALTTLQQRLLVVAYVACAVCILYSLFPFDIVLTSQEFQEKWVLGRISFDLFPDRFLSIDFLKPAIVSILRGLPFGLLLFLRNGKRFGHSLIVLGCISLLIELIQIPIYSKYTRWYDVAFTFLGGCMTLEFLRRRSLWRELLGVWQIWAFAVLIWTIAILFVFLDLKSVLLGQRPIVDRRNVTSWLEFLRPPFAAHYFTSEYSALTNLAEKAMFFSILGGLIAMMERACSQHPKFWWTLLSFGIFLSLGVVIEVTQLHQSHQIADSTDVLFYLLGGVAGLWLTRKINYGSKSSGGIAIER
jgi:VanZ family protein/glycopeptide antibiotics resistance protein